MTEDEAYCDVGGMPKAWCAHCKEPARPKRTGPDLSGFSSRPKFAEARGSRPRIRLAEFDSTCPECQGEILQGDEILPSDTGVFVHVMCGE